MKFLNQTQLLFLCLLLSWANASYAWGNLGHRITAEVAQPLLSSKARQKTYDLLGNESLAEAAAYMDRQRDLLTQRWPDSPRWHYDNQPICSNKPYCRDGACATAQIARMQIVLADHRATRAERAMALRVLIHLLGDIHQPLHMADKDDRGGNNIAVRQYAGAQRTNLHALLDTDLVRQLAGHSSARDYAEDLSRRYQNQFSNWSAGTPTNWAQESHQLAVSKVYGGLPGFSCGSTLQRTITLPPAYLTQAREYLPEQLTKAGLRIAILLNATLR